MPGSLMSLREQSQTCETFTGAFRNLEQIRFYATVFVLTLLDAARHFAKHDNRLAKCRTKIKLDPEPIPALQAPADLPSHPSEPQLHIA